MATFEVITAAAIGGGGGGGGVESVGSLNDAITVDISDPLNPLVGSNEAYLKIDGTAGVYQMGDLNGVGNGWYLSIDDVNNKVLVLNGSDEFLDIGLTSFEIIVGDHPTFASGHAQIQGSGSSLVNGYVGLYAQDTAGIGVQLDLTSTAQQMQLISNNGFKITGDAAFLLHTGQAMTDYAASGAGTITNAPVAGNPALYVGIDINGTTYAIPAWAIS